jgi:heptosyltransferase-2
MKYVFKKKTYLFLVVLFDILGYIFFSPSKLFKKKFAPKKILIVRLDHIGDFICTTPLFKIIKNNYPTSKLSVLVNPVVKNLADKNPYIDEVLIFEAFHLSREKKVSLRSIITLIKKIREGKFDLGIEPRGDLVSIIIMFLGRVRYRAGYGITGGGFLLDKEVKYDKNKHIIEKNKELLKVLNLSMEEEVYPEVYFDEEDQRYIEKILEEINYRKGKGVVLHPFAGTEAKQWNREKFKELITKLKEKGWSIFLVGTEKDKHNYKDIYDLRGKLTLAQLAYLIKRVGFFIGLDSGPAHIASSLGVKSLIICSGTNIVQNWIPPSENTWLIYKDVECKPCERKICFQRNHLCMEDINVEEVINKFDKMSLQR